MERITPTLTRKIVQLPLPVTAAAVYGSWVRGTNAPDSDIDLLVVSDKIHPKKHRRGKDIATIRNYLSMDNPLDILLLTREECLSNFHNHNPLFLDIAWEGRILIDTDSFLGKCIDETRVYIEKKGIVKLPDGWKYPVEYRRATNLSRVSNEDFARAMLDDAHRDYKIGKILTQEEFFDKAVYHFQQAGEKSVKAILICFGNFKKTHFVSDALSRTLSTVEVDTSWKEKLANIAQINKEIEPEVTWSRYPGMDHGSLWLPSLEYTHEDAFAVQEKIGIVLETAGDFVSHWFIK